MMCLALEFAGSWVELGFSKERIDSFFRACKVCPSCPDIGIFLKKADGFGPPDQTEKGFL